MQTSETGSDTGSTVTLQTSVASQAAVPTQVVQQLPVQQQVGAVLSLKKKIELFRQCQFNLLYKFLEKGSAVSVLRSLNYFVMYYSGEQLSTLFLIQTAYCYKSKMVIIFLPACMKLLRSKNTFMI